MIKELQRLIASSDFDAALITSPENCFYFSGYFSDNAFILVNESHAVYITDGRYIEAAENKVKDLRVVLQTSSAHQLKEIFESMGAKTVVVESGRMTLASYLKYSNALEGIELLADGSLDKLINGMRSVKSETEIAHILEAQRIAEKAFDYICSFIKEGQTEKDIQLELDYFMLRNGADALSFDTIALAGANGSVPHGVPSEAKLRKGDFVTLDFGAVCKGYHSDMTRTVALGEVSGEQRLVYDTVLKAQTAAIEKMTAGTPLKEADAAARDVIKQAGFGEYFTHSTGHGVGIEIHEAPAVSERSEGVLKTGNVVTAEPGIYIPGKFGVRIEDMILIKDNGSVNLTRSPKELIIL